MGLFDVMWAVFRFFFPKFAICTGVDVMVTHNHIDLWGVSVITSSFNYKNILLGLAFNDTRYLLLLRGWGGGTLHEPNITEGVLNQQCGLL